MSISLDDLLYRHKIVVFWFPAIARGTYKFTSICPYEQLSVFASVPYSEISESVYRNFLKFGTKFGLPNAREVTFSDFFPKNPVWPVLGQFKSKNALFSLKMDFLANFNKTRHRLFLILHI